MHIKQIVIQGFKSYKDQTIIDPFSPKHNVVVGGNGSGKSNFFAAIRFVLSDAYTHMSREERQALLHEGAGSAVMSAYVEIIFDNTDNRFPTGKDEVTLRRTIGLKKDEYSLDKKSSSKSDVMNLLESAGFSRSNPYYIVPQGRITALTNAKDHERLLLLKEVAGTQVYEQRRTESIKIMEDTKLKQSKIDELLEYIEERLNELEEEKEELREFQEKDREKRCLEYTIYERELSEVNNQLNLIEEERVRVGNISDDRTAEFEERDEQIAVCTQIIYVLTVKRLDTEIAELQQKVELIAFEKRQLDKEHRERVKVRAQIEMEVQDISQDLGRSEQSQLEVVNELQNLDNEIRGKQEELTDMTPTFEAKRAEELDIQQQLEATEGRLEGLYAKQGRNSQFHTKRERDNWLRSEINSITQIKSRQEQLKIELGGEIEETNNRLQHIVQEIENKRSGIGNRRVNIQKVRSELEGAKFERDVLMDERKELWREETKLSSTLEKTKEEVRKAERAFASSTNRETSTALTALPQIIEKYGIQGVYDMLWRLKRLLGIGNLFHIIVENESIAEQIVRALNTEKKGRLTFMPLKRLRPKLPVYPESSDALPMLTKLRFEDKYAKAFQQVFGKTIICPSLDIASQYARSHGLNAITLVGDRSDRKGALTGGFLDSRKSRLAAVRTLKTCRQALEEQSTRAGEVKVALERKEQEITRAVGKYQSLEGKTKELEENAGQGELRRLVQEEGMLNGQIVKKTHSLAAINSALRTLDDQLVAFHSELSSQFTRSLSIEEEQTFNNLKVQVEQLRKSYSEIASQRAELESRKNILENHLKNHLYLRRDQLASRQMDIEMRSTGTLESKQKELEKANKDVDDVSAKLDELESSLDETSSEFQERQKERNTIQAFYFQSSLADRLETTRGHMAKRALLLQKKEECNRNIRDLGVLPEEAFEKYKKVKSETILKRLHKINEALKRFSHVNKKAFDQYNNFTNQKETLTKRREDLDVSKSSIEELIEVLDHRKEEAIERTFKQVSKNFTVIFEKLAPAGTGRLIMQRKIDRTQRTDDNSEEDKNSVENYVGISISVSFNSKEDEQQRIQQLSGGQKSLCALALIFSIQKCDPAPFYLLDEPDANLDAQYRTAVASLLAESTGQFICTTFRPEMIQQAEKFYGVVFHNKVSSVKAIPKEEALRFVEQEQPQ
ncbi:Chromosome segregation protein sudA [Neolecta irregularis DAH-3]|uniref:Structural maintenance of chromosomes protein n=1 Tax=Neolecta irregularis (strain DAH-3) TaxID=1198029 RepID=A0A1U7LUG1_NEOID|nr:Chromosome segregation protein sudA [Neolecta irregularis DAH-3]|eukprot:OLL26315.1 Chromosome segregation protein sudA [Neolecta irregularis DAH-3]